MLPDVCTSAVHESFFEGAVVRVAVIEGDLSDPCKELVVYVVVEKSIDVAVPFLIVFGGELQGKDGLVINFHLMI